MRIKTGGKNTRLEYIQMDRELDFRYRTGLKKNILRTTTELKVSSACVFCEEATRRLVR